MAEAEKCSKCKEALDTEGTPKWCKKCRSAYQREYQDSREGRAEAKGYARGFAAAREWLSGLFTERLGGESCTGYEASRYILTEPLPKD